MEWVETTGKTVEEAKEMALDQLGVDEADAEFEVLEEPKVGLFGRLRGDARVRARVRPQAPPPKLERRDRRRGGGKGPSGRPDDATAPESASRPERSRPERAERPRGGGDRRPRASARASTEGAHVPETRERVEPDAAEVELQIATVRTFLDGLLDAFGVAGEVAISRGDDDAIEAAITGDDLGLLIGPKAATLEALQELARRALQARHPDSVRLRVDVAGYREKRREALARFTMKVADQVKETGEAVSLEPMNAADRKVVHDTCNDVDGVSTSSEGEDPRRRVVISPA